jgi:hypothetical protein
VVVKQIVARIDDELADALKGQAARLDESVNSYLNRLLQVAVAAPGSHRQMWKAGAIVDGRLATRGVPPGRRHRPGLVLSTAVETPAGYSAELVSTDRDER